jgi:hypothetical protein
MNPFLQRLAAILFGTGTSLINLDPNDVGADDVAGQILIYSSEVILSVTSGPDLPPLPEILAKPIEGKISGFTRDALNVAVGIVGLAQFQFSITKPKLALALKYVGQVISVLQSSKPIPAAPAGLATA